MTKRMQNLYQIASHRQQTIIHHWFGKIYCARLEALCQGKVWLFFFSSFEIFSIKIVFICTYRRIEPPDVTGSSLTLATAGSRRTVYLVDEITKLPDTTQTSDSELTGTHSANNRKSSSISNNNASINSSNNNHSTSHDQSPSTFLMYNRISNVIGDPTTIGSSNQHLANNSILSDNASNGNGGKDKKKADDHVWYEYGCVWWRVWMSCASNTKHTTNAF